MKKLYKAKKGANFSNKKAQIYGECLEAIVAEKGIIETPDIVEVARLSDSPLHEYFDWNNRSASEKYRLHQARMLTNNIVTVSVLPTGETIEESGFYNVRITPTQHAYVTAERVLATKNFREQIIENALRELEYWKKKYELYKEFRVVVTAIKRVSGKIRT